MSQPTSWQQESYGWRVDYPETRTMQVDDVHLQQPIGFVWFYKPRYRVKAPTRKMGGVA